MNVIKNYLSGWTESFREWLAFKIFPEVNFYFEANKRMAQLDENFRCVEALKNADSTCSDWAVEIIEVKLTNLKDIMDKWKEEGVDEQPF